MIPKTKVSDHRKTMTGTGTRQSKDGSSHPMTWVWERTMGFARGPKAVSFAATQQSILQHQKGRIQKIRPFPSCRELARITRFHLE